MENVNIPKEKQQLSIMESCKIIALKLWHKLCAALKGCKFITMAVICGILQLFLKHPVAPMVVAMISIIWFIENVAEVKKFAGNLLNFFSKPRSIFTTEPRYSIWYDHGGKEKILAVIERITANGCQYCNLIEEINLPPYSHWPAIGRCLQKSGVQTQVSPDAFFIAWDPQSFSGLL